MVAAGEVENEGDCRAKGTAEETFDDWGVVDGDVEEEDKEADGVDEEDDLVAEEAELLFGLVGGVFGVRPEVGVEEYVEGVEVLRKERSEVAHF